MKDEKQIEIDWDSNPTRPPLKLRGGEGGVMPEDLTQEERLVLSLIEDHAGKENAVTGEIIAQLALVSYNRVREIVSHLVNDHGKLIGSCGKGYYLIVDPDEVEEVYRSLRHRGLSILYRAGRIKKISVVEVFGQGELEGMKHER